MSASAFELAEDAKLRLRLEKSFRKLMGLTDILPI